jgi:hypothetical protein
MSPKLPARIDRAMLDRVLKRAAELQTSGRDIGDEGMTEEEVLALGQEVGIPEAQLRQALLEERVRPIPVGEPGLLDRVIAPAEFAAERVVQGSQSAVSGALTEFLQHHEHLVPQRASGERTTYEPMHAFAGAMRRATAMFDPSRSKPYLDKADLLTAVVTPLEDGFCHVSLVVSMRRHRAAFVGGGAGVGSMGVAGSAVVAAIGGVSLVPAIPLVVGAGIAWLIARGFRPSAERARIGLERVLDALERNPALLPNRGGTTAPRSAILGREVGEAVREFTREVRKALDK